jgi:hypothetical protein
LAARHRAQQRKQGRKSGKPGHRLSDQIDRSSQLVLLATSESSKQCTDDGELLVRIARVFIVQSSDELTTTVVRRMITVRIGWVLVSSISVSKSTLGSWETQ